MLSNELFLFGYLSGLQSVRLSQGLHLHVSLHQRQVLDGEGLLQELRGGGSVPGSAAGQLPDEVPDLWILTLDTVKTAEMKLMGTWAENIADWQNLENFQMNAETIRNRRTENIETLEKDVIIPMMTYREQFAEMKRRVDKCEVKRIDYDRSCFLLQQVERRGLSEEAAEAARQKVDRHRDAYEAIVGELNSVLPSLYEARRQLYSTNLQTLFTLQKCFHNDISFTFRDMSEYVLVKLRNE